MSLGDDLSVFFNLAEFADEVTVLPGNRKFPAIFDEQFFDPESGEMYLEGSKPFLTCKGSDLAADLVKGKRIQVKGKQYSVLQIQTEGTGTAVVILSKIT